MADRLAKLLALEDVILASIWDAPADKRAPLAAQYRAVLAEVAELESDAMKAGDPVDEIAARRTSRGAITAPVSRRAAAHSH